MFKDKGNIKYIAVSICIFITVIVMTVLNIVQNKESKIVVNGVNILGTLEKDKIGVYIDGEVNNPGFIQIPKGKSLEYALNRIGGITKDADIDAVDLKQVLKNGEKVVIPNKKMDVEESEEKQVENDKQVSEKININTASAEELKGLDGIGDKTAEKIIEYRESDKFDSVEEIMEVKGIGEGKYEKIKNNICV